MALIECYLGFGLGQRNIGTITSVLVRTYQYHYFGSGRQSNVPALAVCIVLDAGRWSGFHIEVAPTGVSFLVPFLFFSFFFGGRGV